MIQYLVLWLWPSTKTTTPNGKHKQTNVHNNFCLRYFTLMGKLRQNSPRVFYPFQMLQMEAVPHQVEAPPEGMRAELLGGRLRLSKTRPPSVKVRVPNFSDARLNHLRGYLSKFPRATSCL